MDFLLSPTLLPSYLHTSRAQLFSPRSLFPPLSRTPFSHPHILSLSLRGKVLALELLKIVLENSGPTFRHSEKFISAIRQVSQKGAAQQLCVWKKVGGGLKECKRV